MALTYSALGQVDVPAAAVGQTGGPTDCTVRVADVTIGTATADYSSGLALTGSSLGVNGILGILNAEVRASSGTLRALIEKWDANTSKLRFYLPDIAATSATNKVLAEIVSSVHISNGDIVRVTYVGA